MGLCSGFKYSSIHLDSRIKHNNKRNPGYSPMHTMIDPLKRALQVAPQGIALIDGDTQISYQSLWQRCAKLVSGLRSLGAKDGDRIAILADNSHQ
jgi:non-ribosomal peptide synthetase component E (peptide arylation enzyme)